MKIERHQKDSLQILSFKTPADWEAWLERQPADSPGLWLRIYKKDSGKPTVTYAEALDGALCFGWIDGQKDKYDDAAWLQKFTPRRPRSAWSQINVKKVEALTAAGRMRPGGLAVVEQARADGRWARAYAPQSQATVPDDLQAALDKSKVAREFFATLKGANRYAILFRIRDAKRPETRARLIATFVAMLKRKETLFPQPAPKAPRAPASPEPQKPTPGKSARRKPKTTSRN
ncbi:MAG TPA: YdeI/OmpD-associated family protein, partial [Anaerolineales bacterium]|nr:YdeI/OmpD-associated family protein [Anaerolineales bacterium]HRF49757.1 YdeI/OmpD-associated family protein [Anaerolineales bacterium]